MDLQRREDAHTAAASTCAGPSPGVERRQADPRRQFEGRDLDRRRPVLPFARGEGLERERAIDADRRVHHRVAEHLGLGEAALELEPLRADREHARGGFGGVVDVGDVGADEHVASVMAPRSLSQQPWDGVREPAQVGFRQHWRMGCLQDWNQLLQKKPQVHEDENNIHQEAVF